MKQKAEDAVDSYNRQTRRCKFVKTQIRALEKGQEVSVTLDDEFGTLMTLSLNAPDQRQALRLQKLLESKADEIYSLAMTSLLDEEDSV